jgi:polyadenylate-binding protein
MLLALFYDGLLKDITCHGFQMLPRGRMYRYPPGGRSMTDVPTMPGIAGGVIQPYDMGGFLARDAVLSPAAQIGTLTSALANAAPEQQRTVCLYN